MWAQQREDGRGTWHVVKDTERIECRICRGSLKWECRGVRRRLEEGQTGRGTRSCVQKEQWSPQEWADRAKQSHKCWKWRKSKGLSLASGADH